MKFEVLLLNKSSVNKNKKRTFMVISQQQLNLSLVMVKKKFLIQVWVLLCSRRSVMKVTILLHNHMA